jgi:hypothetical protein
MRDLIARNKNYLAHSHDLDHSSICTAKLGRRFCLVSILTASFIASSSFKRNHSHSSVEILLLSTFPTFHFSQRIFHIDEACHPSPCGVNTKCEVVNYQPICSCLPSYKGNPITGCTHECDADHDCSSNQYCKNFKCQSACDLCGKGALCNGVVNHRPQCECPKNYIGSPFTECRAECYGDVDCPRSKPACFYGGKI